ncbi:beta-trefoil [Favolaschia claudopus]|uniref:Beta-trefoil n=1 Tax=Favolaschia claudopus TaxID=2862362 RepID=A0AAW0AQR5_9AGAR
MSSPTGTSLPSALPQSSLTHSASQSASSPQHTTTLTEDPHAKIRRNIRDYVLEDLNRDMIMTTVVCLHAAVARRSYGNERRFLCPPPRVQVEGPAWQMKRQVLTMSVVSEHGENLCEHAEPLDNNMTSTFKVLYISGEARTKSVHLSLKISEPSNVDSDPGHTWATFNSAPILAIAKPSTTTSKMSTWIVSGKPVSLFHRIHSQTVSTRYMTMDHGTLSASKDAWSAFSMHIVPPATDTPSTGHLHPITHGCSIILTDTCSGISSPALIVRKVSKGTVCQNDGNPVNQMEKIALQRVNSDGTRCYLSTPRLAFARREDNMHLSATVSSEQGESYALLFQPPHTRYQVENGVQIEVDDLDDHLCWTIVGISKLQYTFFDARALNDSPPHMPITPFPTLSTSPAYCEISNTLELAGNFSYADPTTGERLLLDIYIGSLGPLPARTHQIEGVTGTTVAIVQMPSIGEVIRVLEKDTLKAAEGSSLPLLFIRPTDSVGYRMGPTMGLLRQALRVL